MEYDYYSLRELMLDILNGESDMTCEEFEDMIETAWAQASISREEYEMLLDAWDAS